MLEAMAKDMRKKGLKIQFANASERVRNVLLSTLSADDISFLPKVNRQSFTILQSNSIELSTQVTGADETIAQL